MSKFSKAAEEAARKYVAAAQKLAVVKKAWLVDFEHGNFVYIVAERPTCSTVSSEELAVETAVSAFGDENCSIDVMVAYEDEYETSIEQEKGFADGHGCTEIEIPSFV